jgi:hypothetical protein
VGSADSSLSTSLEDKQTDSVQEEAEDSPAARLAHCCSGSAADLDLDLDLGHSYALRQVRRKNYIRGRTTAQSGLQSARWWCSLQADPAIRTTLLAVRTLLSLPLPWAGLELWDPRLGMCV